MSEPIFKRGLQSKVSSLPIEDGSLIFGYDNSSNFSTFQFDQSVNSTLKRLGVTVACSSTSDYSKNALALNGSSLDDILSKVDNNDKYLPLIGGEMKGILSLFKNQNSDSYSGALNANNSNIYNLNNLYFNALSNGINNTINFYKDSEHVDSLWSKNGILYYSPNRSFTRAGEENIILHSKNINDYAAQVEHTHGLASSSLVISIPSVETGGWNLIDEKIDNGSQPSGFTLKSVKTNDLTPDWMFNNASGLAFGGDSYRATITVPYLNPGIRIAGGNGTSPRWFFSITGTNGNSYDLDSFITSSGLENINADSATRIISSGKSIANNFTFRTGIPLSSGWNNFPIWQLTNSQKPELIDYKNKSVSILHLDGETQRHDIVALNEPNSGLIYATGTTAVGSSSRIERILDGGNYGSLISDLNKHVNLNDGFTAQTNVELDGGNYASGSTVDEGDEGGNSGQSIEIYVTGTTLVINTI